MAAAKVYVGSLDVAFQVRAMKGWANPRHDKET
jgi:hypothetical protein